MKKTRLPIFWLPPDPGTQGPPLWWYFCINLTDFLFCLVFWFSSFFGFSVIFIFIWILIVFPFLWEYLVSWNQCNSFLLRLLYSIFFWFSGFHLFLDFLVFIFFWIFCVLSFFGFLLFIFWMWMSYNLAFLLL